MTTLFKLSELANSFDKEIDLFICSSSFEERCFAVANQLSLQSMPVKKALICFNSNEYDEIIKNSVKLCKLFGKKATALELNSDAPLQNGVKLNDTLEALLGKKKMPNILLDTTTFTHETLLVIVRLLYFKKELFKNLYIVYVGAEDYSINVDDINGKWLSMGISEIRSVLGYPGTLSPARGFHLIILFGFEIERTKKLIDDYQFDKVSIGFGDSQPITENHRKLNYLRHKDLLEQYPYAEAFDVSLTDPLLAKNQILKQVQKYNSFNSVLAPMNNKLSTVGSALAAIEDSKIQLIYAKPISYNTSGYSIAKDECYLYSIL